MKKKILKNIAKILLVINTSFFIVSLSISVPILFRPFYYYQIKALDIENKSGYDYDTIKEAYDDMIDYTTSIHKEFKTGKLKYTKEGMNHFRDCKILFMINFLVLALSTVIIIIKKKFFNKIKLLKHNIGFWSAISLLISFMTLIGTYLIIGFDRFFELFHKILFLGKTNWTLDVDEDEIINILPNEFFVNCAILVVSIISIISIILIIKEIYDKNARRTKA